MPPICSHTGLVYEALSRFPAVHLEGALLHPPVDLDNTPVHSYLNHPIVLLRQKEHHTKTLIGQFVHHKL